MSPDPDPRVWRVTGDPLVAGTPTGPLAGTMVAVKDLYAVAGQRVGAGNPAWLAQAPVETAHAPVVERLLAAGADVRGIAQTEEFAYGLTGTNAHHGMPPNPRAPGRVPGGSSSGSASAVALGEADLGLGTDTAGSVRVPAAYQGLYGLRTSHGSIDTDGLLALAPSYDAVGWLTRDAALLAAVGDVLLPPGGHAGGGLLPDLVVVPRLLDLATPDVADAVAGRAVALGAVPEDWDLTDLPRWLAAFQRVQAWEAWEVRGAWLADRLDTLGDDVRGRFENAARVHAEGADEARATVAAAHDRILELVADRVLVLPSAASVAPHPGAEARAAREATLRLTCLASLAGLPGVSVPAYTTEGLPCGVGLLAAPGRDRDLLRLAEQTAEA